MQKKLEKVYVSAVEDFCKFCGLLTVQRPNFITDIIPLQTFHLTSVEDYATILDLT